MRDVKKRESERKSRWDGRDWRVPSPKVDTLHAEWSGTESALDSAREGDCIKFVKQILGQLKIVNYCTATAYFRFLYA